MPCSKTSGRGYPGDVTSISIIEFADWSVEYVFVALEYAIVLFEVTISASANGFTDGNQIFKSPNPYIMWLNWNPANCGPSSATCTESGPGDYYL